MIKSQTLDRVFFGNRRLVGWVSKTKQVRQQCKGDVEVILRAPKKRFPCGIKRGKHKGGGGIDLVRQFDTHLRGDKRGPMA